MRRLLALVPALLFAGAGMAQDISAASGKDLWCGIALDLAARDVPVDAVPEVLAVVGPYRTGAETLLGRTKSAHLEAGYTEEAFDALKAETEAEIVKQLSGADPAIDPAYSFEDCAALVGL